MRYLGIQTQIDRNNRRTVALLLAFPAILLGMVWAFLAAVQYLASAQYDDYGNTYRTLDTDAVNYAFMQAMPWVVGGVAVWFAIAYFANAAIVAHSVQAKPLERRQCPRLYNIVENLCMTAGMDTPKINIAADDYGLNAFASGIGKDSYTVTVTQGLLDLLDDEELAGVVAHELTHIRNRDTRLLITCIVFVGIVSTVMSFIVRSSYYLFYFGSDSRDNENQSRGLSVVVVMVIALICCAIAYLFVLLTRFAISRKREFMADAGGAELCGNPRALASALRKISGDPGLQKVTQEGVSQLFIIQPVAFDGGAQAVRFLNSMFTTHPDTRERIRILEQF